MKTRIKLYDKIMPPTTLSMGCGRIPVDLPFEWYRGNEYCDIAVFTDQSLDEVDSCDSKYKFAVLMESPEIFPEPYKQIVDIHDKFTKVLTFDYDTLLLRDNVEAYYLGGCWIKPDEQEIHEKRKNWSMSIIASDKRTTKGQKLRHEIIKEFGDRIDVYGKGYKPIDSKLDGLKNYDFSIVVENCRRDYYFTEKLIDCFLTGTIPIYWGCPCINEIFYPEGMISFESIEDLNSVLNISYLNDLFAGLDKTPNFERAKKYRVPEEWIWKAIKKYD